MAEIGVIGEEGPQLLGVFHSCARNYATLEDLEFDTARKERLLFGLLNARVVLAALRSALVLHRLDYPAIWGGSHSERMYSRRSGAHSQWQHRRRSAPVGDEARRSGCDAIDSFGGSDLKRLPGSETFSA